MPDQSNGSSVLPVQIPKKDRSSNAAAASGVLSALVPSIENSLMNPASGQQSGRSVGVGNSIAPGSRKLAAGGEAFAEWRRSQPAAATAWLNELPLTDPRRVPYLQSAVRVLAWDQNASAQLAAFSPGDRAIARTVIGEMKLPDDRRAALLEMLEAK